MPIDPLPVQRQASSYPTQQVRGQMRNLHPGQNQEAAIVSQEADILAARLGQPANEAVAAPQMPRCRGPGQAGNGSASGLNQILQLFPDRLGVTEVVVMLEQAVEEAFPARAPHQLQLQRLDLGQRGDQRSGI